ncbi:MAG: hypothetical protein SGI90_02700 [Candidatus Eisenbacteria bacterium]|nr:hypothetical protein [Candidatus Eisenbacteria bacterium]
MVGIPEYKRKQIAAACARHGVLRLDVFGILDAANRSTPTSTFSMN